MWSVEEIARAVIKASGLHVHAAGVLAGFSGLRVGEIAGLLWSDLDLDRGFVCVSRTVEEDEDKTLVASTRTCPSTVSATRSAPGCTETYGVKQAQEWLGHGDPSYDAAALRTAHDGGAGEGRGRPRQVTRTALERAEEKVLEDARPLEDNVVALASRRR